MTICDWLRETISLSANLKCSTIGPKGQSLSANFIFSGGRKISNSLRLAPRVSLSYRVVKMHRIECLKLYVSFRKRATKYRALLRQRICKDKVSSASSPPCIKFTENLRQKSLRHPVSGHRMPYLYRSFSAKSPIISG